MYFISMIFICFTPHTPKHPETIQSQTPYNIVNSVALRAL